VVEEYYKQELAFQEEIDAEENLKSLSSKIKGQKTADGWLLSFPTEMEESVVSGTIEFYRPSNKKLDFQRPLDIENNVLLIPDENLVGGRWDISIRWKSKTKEFLYKDRIIY
ncbi:MAG: FixH family protein, partial [Flavobacteriaceae bacterium]|nr:FixH family protein [Flavobacteriaceae bacterium]